MPRPDTAARLVLIEEALERIEDALERIEATLGARETRLPIADIRTAIEETSATAEVAQQLAEAVPAAVQQLEAIASTLDAQLPGEEMRDKLRNELSYVRQLISVMQGTRDDVVAMRVTLRSLAALLEQVLRARVADEEWEQGKVDRRRAG